MESTLIGSREFLEASARSFPLQMVGEETIEDYPLRAEMMHPDSIKGNHIETFPTPRKQGRDS